MTRPEDTTTSDTDPGPAPIRNDIGFTEARLDAQRRLLQWLLLEIVGDSATFHRVLDTLDAPWPPVDHQEDPGAVNSTAFGLMAAYNREMRMLLRPLKDKPPA
jgi:hypothetical protein